MPNINELKDLIQTLSQADKHELLALLSSSASDSSGSLDSLQEARFSGGFFCPKCGCTENIVRYGKHGDKQRYLCKNCRSTFTATSSSLLHGTRKPLEVWEKYLDCLIEGHSLKKCSQICSISIPTAFYWRHKILDALTHKLKRDGRKLEGIVESDETYFPLSYKGQKNNLPREAKKRATPASKRGLSLEQVCVACGLDRSGTILSGVSNLGKVSAVSLNRFYSGRVQANSTFCTDSEKSYVKFARDNGYRLFQIERGKHKKGIYHINHVNGFHSNLKRFIDKFNGIASKYLNNYLTWNLIRKFSTAELLKSAMSIVINVTNFGIGKREVLEDSPL